MGLIHLSSREECLSVLPINHISVNIHIIECIVLFNSLSLIVEFESRLIIIYSDVGNRLFIIGNILTCQIRSRFEALHINIIEIIRILSKLYISLKISAFFADFIRCNNQTLNQHGSASSNNSNNNHQNRSYYCRLNLFLADSYCKSDSSYNRKHHDYSVHPQCHIYICETCSINCACTSKEKIILSQEKVNAYHQEEKYAYDNKLFFSYRKQHLKIVVIELLFLFRFTLER